MTIQEIYGMLEAGKKENDEIPIGVLADMLEEASCNPERVKHLRGENVKYEFHLLRGSDVWSDLEWCPTWCIAGGPPDMEFLALTFLMIEGDPTRLSTSLSLVLYRPPTE